MRGRHPDDRRRPRRLPMTFTPPRLLGLVIGCLIFVLASAGAAVGVAGLANATVSPWIVLWVSLPLLGVPVALMAAYRVYGLLTAGYSLDRDRLRVRWGLAQDEIPLSAITRLGPPGEGLAGLRPGPGFWWPGCVVGRKAVDGRGEIEFFATRLEGGLVLVEAGERRLALSPSDPEAFRQAYLDATRMGSLERIAGKSVRPDFFLGRLWSDGLARGLVLAGVVLPLLQLGYLAVQAAGLPVQVPFGFNAVGAPDPFVPPGRLLLLPMLGGLCWLIDLAIGAWLYRRPGERPLAYGLWSTSVLVGLLLWGASLELLAVVLR